MANIFWPPVDDIEDAKKACKQAAGISFFVGVLTSLIAYLHIAKILNLIPGMGPAAYIDAGLFVVIGGFLIRYSRIAAVAGLLLYAGEQVFSMILTGPRFNLVAIFFILAYMTGVRGAFAYHRFKKQEDSEAPAPSPEHLYPQAPAPAEEKAAPKKKAPVLILVLSVLVLGGVAAGIFFNRDKLFGSGGGGPALPFQKSSAPKPMSDEDIRQAYPELAGTEEKQVTLKLKNGKSITGRILYEDETYYTLKTGTGQEFIIKEDVVSS